MRVLKLSRGYVAKVDSRDYAWLSQWKWHALVDKRNPARPVYGRRNVRLPNGKRMGVLLHRSIVGARPGQKVDHKNSDGLDNRRLNLRTCTHMHNMHNRIRPVTNTSGYKGVSRAQHSPKWRVYLTVKGVRMHLGHFTELVEAARAYDQAAKQHHGQFANLNFP